MSSNLPVHPSAPDRSSGWVSAEFQVDGSSHRYRIRGTGPLIVVLSLWREGGLLRQCESLATKARVIIPELSGNGPPLATSWIRGLAEVFGSGEAIVLADRSAGAAAFPLVGAPGLLVSLILEA